MQLWYVFCNLQIMGIHIYHHHHYPEMDDVKNLLQTILKKQTLIMATQAETLQELLDLKAQVDKANTEIVTKIAALEAAIVSASNTTPEVDAALAALKASIQVVDDIVPDAQ